MTSRMDIMWPTSDWSPTGWLGMRATWSMPLSQSGLSPETIDELEQSLKKQMQVALSEGENAAFDRDMAPESRIEILQIGSAAEPIHGLYTWLKELPHEVLIALLAERTARGFSVVAGHVKGRIEAFRRVENGHEITARLSFHPDFLLALCLEHVVVTHGVTTVNETSWRPLTEDEQAAFERVWPPSEQVWIDIVTDDGNFTFRVDELGSVLEHRARGSPADAPTLVPDVHPVPVAPPTFQDPYTGQAITGWPSQDGIDRSDHIAIIAILGADFGANPLEDMKFVERAEHIAPQVQYELERAVQLAVSEVIPNSTSLEVVASHYQVGPMASGLAGLEHYIVELFQSRDAIPAIIGNLSEAWVVYEIASRVKKHLTSWISRFGDPRLDITIAYPAAVLADVCERYVRQHFHPRALLRTEWFCLTANFYSGYLSPGHPTGAVEYLVVVMTATRAYRFRVWGDGTVSSLWMQEGKQEIQLAKPSLFEGEDIRQ